MCCNDMNKKQTRPGLMIAIIIFILKKGMKDENRDPFIMNVSLGSVDWPLGALLRCSPVLL